MSLIPGGSQTYSKQANRFPPNAPKDAVQGKGAMFMDSENRWWLDYVSALGPVILGYRYPRVNDAIRYQLDTYGISFSLPNRLEEEVARRIVDMVPSAEMVRFGKNGADACTAAVRIARAATERDVVLQIGYHGYGDWYQAGMSRGVPATKDLLRVPWGNVEAFQVAFHYHRPPVAAVIMEPVVSQHPVLPKPGYLQAIRDLCDKHGALLIFDEMVTAFRVAIGGYQEVAGVTPDLTCLGKAMANGMPLSVVCGKAEYMELIQDGVFYSTTFAGETLSLAAASATLDVIKSRNVPKALAEHGGAIMELCRSHIQTLDLETHVNLLGYAARPVLKWWDPAVGDAFAERITAHGILYQGYFNVMLAHEDEHLEQTAAALGDAFEVAAKMVEGK